MEAPLALAFGVMMTVAAWLILSRNLLRLTLGLLVLGNAVNLALFVAGRLPTALPPLVTDATAAGVPAANPLPQALILTAIVISFALVAFAVVLFERAERRLGTLDTDAMRVAEPETRSTAR
ncbi:MAG: NADH-quinone oxidoreductase subunit K [Lautropia sp.]